MDFHFHIAVTVTDYTVNIKGIFQQKTSEPKQNKHLHGRQRRFCVCTQNFIFNSCDTFCNGHFLWKLLISFLFIPWQQMIWCRDRSVFLCVGGEHVCKYWVMLKRSQHWRPQYKTWWTVRSSQTKCATFLFFCFWQMHNSCSEWAAAGEFRECVHNTWRVCFEMVPISLC